MAPQRALIDIWIADLAVRSAYQMGKAPLLPLFAISLGASEPHLSYIVSVSTLTGMLLKPAVGILCDLWGRRGTLILGTALFAGVLFLYRFMWLPCGVLS
jgi:MFS family permease